MPGTVSGIRDNVGAVTLPSTTRFDNNAINSYTVLLKNSLTSVLTGSITAGSPFWPFSP